MSAVCQTNQMALFFLLLNTLVTLHPKIGDPCGRVTPVEKTEIIYDFIVVGGKTKRTRINRSNTLL